MLNEQATKIYEYIVVRISQNLSPTVREICQDLNIKSTSTVHRYISQLCELGLIMKLDKHNRSIQLPHHQISWVPVLGNVAAGLPITAIEDIQGYVPFDSYGKAVEQLFALRVQGDSMINVGILENNIVIVQQTSIASNGKIVVALVDDEATVKTFYQEQGYVRLQPENNNLDSMLFERVTILGQVIATIRYFT